LRYRDLLAKNHKFSLPPFI